MPPTGRVLLDTNILIGLLAAEPAILGGLRTAEAVYIPVIALGELYYGARKSARAAENIERVAAFAAAAAVLHCDATTAAIYGELKAQLRAQCGTSPRRCTPGCRAVSASKPSLLPLLERDIGKYAR